jgi:hypothetical protein
MTREYVLYARMTDDGVFSCVYESAYLTGWIFATGGIVTGEVLIGGLMLLRRDVTYRNLVPACGR